jgi:enoyl-CoA hydratase/carnithine racemase
MRKNDVDARCVTRYTNQRVLTGLAEALDGKADLQEIATRTVDHHEGVQAFLEKRAARFIGK